MPIRSPRIHLSRNQWFFAIAAIAVVVKLWLVSEIRVIPLDAPYDASNYVEHAKSILTGHWFGPYDVFTLIKGPAFPIYMALVADFGIPLPLAHQFLYAFACFVACWAIRPLDRRGIAAPVVFVVLLFNPFTFATMSWVSYRSQLYESAALISVACAVGAYIRRTGSIRRSLPWFVGLGAAITVFALTREESIWIVPSMLAAAAVWIAAAAARVRGREFWGRTALVAIPFFMWWGSNVTVATVNRIVYHWATVVELQSPEFVSAYNSLARIDVPNDRSVTIPRAARMIAYSVSPAARELRHSLDDVGSQGRNWVQVSCNQGFSCVDIPEGWFIFSLRYAVAEAGHYDNGADARAFYLRLAAEVDHACDSGIIHCRRKGWSLSPPLYPSDVVPIVQRFFIDMQKVLVLSTFDLTPWPALPTSAALVDDYEFVTRATLPSSGTTYVGWMPHEKLRNIQVVDDRGQDTHAIISFTASPDIYAYFLRDPLHKTEETGLARFTIVSTCASGCSLVVTGERGDVTSIALSMASRSIRTPHLTFYLDRIATDTSYAAGDDGFKAGVLRAIASGYRLVLPFLFFVMLVQVIIRLSSRDRLAEESDHAVVSAVSLLASGSLVALLALIEVISFPAFVPEYMGASIPLLLFAISVAPAIEAERSGSFFGQLRLYAATAVVLLIVFGGARLIASATAPNGAAVQKISISSGGCSHVSVRPRGLVSGWLDAATTRSGSVQNAVALPADSVVTFKGWAADTAITHPLATVCVIADGAPLRGQEVSYGLDRPDVVRFYGRPQLEQTGYEIRAPLGALGRGRHRLEVVGVDANGLGSRIGRSLDLTVQ